MTTRPMSVPSSAAASASSRPLPLCGPMAPTTATTCRGARAAKSPGTASLGAACSTRIPGGMRAVRIPGAHRSARSPMNADGAITTAACSRTGRTPAIHAGSGSGMPGRSNELRIHEQQIVQRDDVRQRERAPQRRESRAAVRIHAVQVRDADAGRAQPARRDFGAVRPRRTPRATAGNVRRRALPPRPSRRRRGARNGAAARSPRGRGCSGRRRRPPPP